MYPRGGLWLVVCRDRHNGGSNNTQLRSDAGRLRNLVSVEEDNESDDIGGARRQLKRCGLDTSSMPRTREQGIAVRGTSGPLLLSGLAGMEVRLCKANACLAAKPVVEFLFTLVLARRKQRWHNDDIENVPR